MPIDNKRKPIPLVKIHKKIKAYHKKLTGNYLKHTNPPFVNFSLHFPHTSIVGCLRSSMHV